MMSSGTEEAQSAKSGRKAVVGCQVPRFTHGSIHEEGPNVVASVPGVVNGDGSEHGGVLREVGPDPC